MDKRLPRASEKTGAPHTHQGTKLGDMLMTEKQQKGQGIGRKSATENELVRYMSNLSNNLENVGGRKVREKKFSVGNLDWGRLEKWRHNNHKQLANKDNGYSPSCSSTSQNSSTDQSCTHSSRRHSCSPARPRMPRSSQQSHPEASPSKNHNPEVSSYCSRDQSCSPAHQRNQQRRVVPESNYSKVHPGPMHVNLLRGSTGKLQEPCAAPMSRHQKPLGTDQHLRKTEAEIRVDRCQRKDFVSSSSLVMGKHKTSVEPDVLYLEGNKKAQDGHTTEEVVRQQEHNYRESAQRKKTVVVLLPKGSTPHNRSKVKHDEKQAEKVLQGLSDNCDEDCGLSSRSDIPYSCPLPSRDECMKGPFSTSATEEIIAPSSQPSRPLPHCGADMSSSSLISKIIEEKRSITLLQSTGISKSSADLCMKRGSESTTRRSASPIKRLSNGVGKIIRNVGSRDNTPLRRSCSKDPPAKFGPEKAVVANSVSDSSCSDKSVANYRSRGSPLRRLLDPLFKPKSNHQVAADGFRRDSASTAGHCSASEQKSAKAEARVTIGRTTSCSDTHSHPKNKSSSSSSFQALLQVAVKDDLPLYTFAVDSNSEILAATLRKSSASEKDHTSWTYTFFTVNEIKKKNGLRIHQGSKATAPGYDPKVVAQMKVSDPSQFANVTGKHRSSNHECTARDFTLFAVDVGQQIVDEHAAAEFHPTNELAAIVVRISKANSPNDGRQPVNINNMSGAYTTRESTSLPAAWNNQPSVSSNDCAVSTTVILPSGVHTVPSKGAVSTLIQRWESGGSCDCGGWDLGCQLRVYRNRIEPDKRSGLTESATNPAGAAEFKLSCQAADEENQTILSIRPFKERIHSVEFSSSLSLLQAFAVCVSALDCKRPSFGLLEAPPDNLTFPSRPFLDEDDVNSSKVLNQNQLKAVTPARYVSYPRPHSLVGRV